MNYICAKKSLVIPLSFARLSSIEAFGGTVAASVCFAGDSDFNLTLLEMTNEKQN